MEKAKLLIAGALFLLSAQIMFGLVGYALWNDGHDPKPRIETEVSIAI